MKTWHNMQAGLKRALWQAARKSGSVPNWAGVSRVEASVIRAKWADRVRTRTALNAAQPLPLLQRWAAQPRIRRIGEALLAAMPRLGYSMGSLYIVEAKHPSGRGSVALARLDTCRQYAKSCKWSAQHGELRLTLSPGELAHARVIGGVITIARRWPRRNHKSDVVPCTWLEFLPRCKKSLMPCKRVGYLCQTSHADTREGALRNAREVRMAHVAAWQDKRACRRHQLDERAIEAAKLAIYGRQIAISRADSYAVGNCAPGTEAWISRAGLTGDTCLLGDLAGAIERSPHERERAHNVVARILRPLPLLPARLCDVANTYL